MHQRNSSKPKHKGRGCGGHRSHSRSQSRKHPTPSLQRVLTDVHIKPTGINQLYWTKQCFKIDSGACGNLMPLSMYKSMYNHVLSSTTVNSAAHLLDYNKHEIKEYGTCVVSAKYRSNVKQVPFYVVSDKLKPIIGVSDAFALRLTSFHCPIYTDWQSNLTNSVDSIHSNANSTICRASARPPAFLSTTSHIPSSLEGTRNRKALNGYRSCSWSVVIEHRPLN